MAFHQTTEKALVFAGDKLGSLGIFDSAESKFIKSEDDEEEDDVKLAITQLKLHTRTISSLQFHEHDHKSLYTGSYDSTIRKFDLEKGLAVEVYAPSDEDDEEGVSAIQLVASEPNMVYFTTLNGRFGIKDLRTKAKDNKSMELFELSEKKIGGFSITPGRPHILATASLDRTMKVWDLRKIEGKGSNRTPFLIGEHESSKSVSSASFNYAGQVVTASYDDTVKVYDFNKCLSNAPGKALSDAELKPISVVPHNNQTGRWVTM
jgi:WD repeat-containing protein 76